MRQYCTLLCEEIDTQIKELTSNKPTTTSTPNIIICLQGGINKLKKYMDDHPFTSSDEEIYFFKILKPKILSRLIYYKKLYQIELEKPLGSLEQKKTHLNIELDTITKHCIANAYFIQYMRSGETHFDQKYFIRKNAYQIPIHDSFSCEIDYEHGTGYDFRIALIQAHEMLEQYLNQQLENLRNSSHTLSIKKNNTALSIRVNSELNWTGPQAALVEVIYALYFTGVFNDGNAEIKDIAECFENTFNIEINQIYRTYSSIKNRKNGPLKFIDFMKSTLEKSITDELKF